jgi:hypothetical protein
MHTLVAQAGSEASQMLSNIHILLVDVSVLHIDKLMIYRQLTEWGACVKEGIITLRRVASFG